MVRYGAKELANVRLISPLLKRISDKESVYKNVCLDDVPILVRWYPSEGFIKFIQNVRLAENPEILFRDGAFNLFTGRKAGRDKALDLFNKAAQTGHVFSRYVIGLLLLLKDDLSGLREGVEILSELWQENCLAMCRAKLRRVSRVGASVAPRVSQVGLKKWYICNSRDTCKGWTEDHNRLTEDILNPHEVCKNCRLDAEIEWFCRLCLMEFP